MATADDIARAAEAIQAGLDGGQDFAWLAYADVLGQVETAIQTEGDRLSFPTDAAADTAAEFAMFVMEQLRTAYLGMVNGFGAIAAGALREISHDRGISPSEALVQLPAT
jgi:hypothetical protein